MDASQELEGKMKSAFAKSSEEMNVLHLAFPSRGPRQGGGRTESWVSLGSSTGPLVVRAKTAHASLCTSQDRKPKSALARKQHLPTRGCKRGQLLLSGGEMGYGGELLLLLLLSEGSSVPPAPPACFTEELLLLSSHVGQGT